MISPFLALAGLLWVHASTAAPRAAAGSVTLAGRCAPSAGLGSICGVVASEDLVRIPASKWLIASGMNVGTPAHLYLVDSKRRRATVAFPTEGDAAVPVGRSTMGCSGPPDPQRMSLDGLALRPGAHGIHTLYATNHGDRMAVELFAVDERSGRLQLRWIDCAPLPAHTLPNAVSTLPGAGFLVISFYDPADTQAWARMARGEMTGHVLRWLPDKGFAPLPDGATSGGNGLATSADGGTIYASSWSARKLIVLSLRTGTRREIPLEFMPDNVHLLDDGSLLVAGQRTTVDAIHACQGPQCPQPWVVAQVDPQTGAVRTLLEGRGTPQVNYACGAILVGTTLFITARGDQRILFHSYPGVLK